MGERAKKGKEMSDNESENKSGTDPGGNSSKESDFQSAMLKMMSDFKAEILANVQESVAQVYQDFGYTDDANSNENQQLQDSTSIISGEAEQVASKIDQITNSTQNKEIKSIHKSSEKAILNLLPHNLLQGKNRTIY